MKQRRGLSPWVAAAALTLAVPLPAAAESVSIPWLARDIGLPTPLGSTDRDPATGVWTLQGSGLDIWDDYDQFHFVSPSIKGDGSISARFLNASGGDSSRWRKAGLMVRESDTPGAPHLLYAMTPVHGLYAQARFEQDLPPRYAPGIGPANGEVKNLAMRLQRVGQEFSGFYSRDGALWFQAGFGPLALPLLKEEALWGIALTSHLDGKLATARFDQVSVQPGVTSPYGLLTCGSDRSVQLQWRRLPNAVGYFVYRGPQDAARAQLMRLTAEPLNATSYPDTSGGLVNGTPVLYAVSAAFRAPDGSLAEGPLVTLLGMPVSAPQGMLGCSINEGPGHGSAAVDPSTGVITLRGGGSWFNANGDQGYFLSRVVEGDNQITVRMLGKVTTGGPDRLAGLMIRESLERDARQVTIGLYGSLSNSFLLREWRATTNGFLSVFLSHSGATINAPVLLRLTRMGNSITPAYSLDEGKNWVMHRPVTFEKPLPSTLYFGLAITGGNIFGSSRTQMGEAQFSTPEFGKP